MIKNYKYIIPLGWNCTTAWHLRINSLRKEAYPFDWCETPFEALSQILENDFEHFFDDTSIRLEDIVLTKEKGHDEMTVESRVYKGNVFRHEWSIVKDKKNGFNDEKEKYKRRIERFHDAINSKEPILFVRFIQEKDNEDFTKINNLLRKIYPKLAYSLLVIKEVKKSELKKSYSEKSYPQTYFIETPKDNVYFDKIAYDIKWSLLFLKIKMINRFECLYFIFHNFIFAYAFPIDEYIGKAGMMLEDKNPKLYYYLKRFKGSNEE